MLQFETITYQFELYFCFMIYNYSKFFAGVNKEHTFKSLSATQVGHIMNIVALERSIASIVKIKESYKGTPNYHKWDLFLFKENRLLVEITHNTEPLLLLQQMYDFSKS